MSSIAPAISLKPDWLKVRAPGGQNYSRLKSLFRQQGLHTVCEEAHCPNVSECWGGGTATLMLMGDVCTRGCHFCHVKSGNPKGVLDLEEPAKVAQALSQMGLTYVVLTSVDRDDLPDGGADHFARTVEHIKEKVPELLVEVLIPDFRNHSESLERIAACGANVVAHNLETVKRLTATVRDGRCGYVQSLKVLERLKGYNSTLYTKSSLMVGLGETYDEILGAMDDLRKASVDILTVGQYLRPSHWHLPVVRYVPPDEFEALGEEGRRRGFLHVASGPLVRSSYRAGEVLLEKEIRLGQSPAPFYEGGFDVNP